MEKYHSAGKIKKKPKFGAHLFKTFSLEHPKKNDSVIKKTKIVCRGHRQWLKNEPKIDDYFEKEKLLKKKKSTFY